MARAKAKKSFEEMLLELEERTARMEAGQLSLDEMLAEYAAGMELVRACRERLLAAESVLAEKAGEAADA